MGNVPECRNSPQGRAAAPAKNIACTEYTINMGPAVVGMPVLPRVPAFAGYKVCRSGVVELEGSMEANRRLSEALGAMYK